jgi:hypothetical protein
MPYLLSEMKLIQIKELFSYNPLQHPGHLFEVICKMKRLDFIYCFQILKSYF